MHSGTNVVLHACDVKCLDRSNCNIRKELCLYQMHFVPFACSSSFALIMSGAYLLSIDYAGGIEIARFARAVPKLPARGLECGFSI
jgi:hypothetical protein